MEIVSWITSIQRLEVAPHSIKHSRFNSVTIKQTKFSIDFPFNIMFSMLLQNASQLSYYNGWTDQWVRIEGIFSISTH